MPYTRDNCIQVQTPKEKLKKAKKGLLLCAFKLYRHSIDICIFFYPMYVISVWHEKLLFEKKRKEREREKVQKENFFFIFLYVEANNSFKDFLNKHWEREKWIFKEHQGWLINATHCIQQQQNYHVHFLEFRNYFCRMQFSEKKKLIMAERDEKGLFSSRNEIG